MSRPAGIEIVRDAVYRGKDGIDRRVTAIVQGRTQRSTIVYYTNIDSEFSGNITMINFRYFYAREKIHG